jgi:large subunit ribosomal protein L25
MAQFSLSARIRDDKGKGMARRLRRDDRIPAVFYGPNAKTTMLSVSYSDLKGIMKQNTSENIILGLQIESESGIENRKVMLKELQIDPIKDTFLHADFYEISMDKELTVDIPVHLVNAPIGVQKGGILQHVRREITITCLPDDLVDSLEVDVSGLDIGDSVHLRDIEIPEGIKTTQEDHLTIAVVVTPSVAPEEEEVEEIEEVEETEDKKVEEEGEDKETQSG